MGNWIKLSKLMNLFPNGIALSECQRLARLIRNLGTQCQVKFKLTGNDTIDQLNLYETLQNAEKGKGIKYSLYKRKVVK